MNSKKLKAIALGTALVSIASIGGLMAYFTDADTQTNEFLVGKISLDFQEPNWNPDNGKNIMPMKTVKKDPQIMNDGVNDEFVFLEVIVPYAHVVTANADGTKNPASDTELFNYTVNKGWLEMTDEKKVTENTVRHLYVWGTNEACTPLLKNVTTGSLFDTVTMANVVEDQGLEETPPEIVINAYGIQTSDLDGKKVAPKDVWKILANQAPTTDEDVAEHPNTDVKGETMAVSDSEDETKNTEEKDAVQKDTVNTAEKEKAE